MRLNNAKEQAALDHEKHLKEREKVEFTFSSSQQEKDVEIERYALL
jgi:hypothetical protein